MSQLLDGIKRKIKEYHTPWNDRLPLAERQKMYDRWTARFRDTVRDTIALSLIISSVLTGGYSTIQSFGSAIERKKELAYQETFYNAGYPAEALEHTCAHAYLDVDDDDPHSPQEICDDAQRAFLQEKTQKDFGKEDTNLERLLAAYSGHDLFKPFPYQLEPILIKTPPNAVEVQAIAPPRPGKESNRQDSPEADQPSLEEAVFALVEAENKVTLNSVRETMIHYSHEKIVPYHHLQEVYTIPFSLEDATILPLNDPRERQMRILFTEENGGDPNSNHVFEVLQPDHSNQFSVEQLKDVRAVYAADVHPHPGNEIILLTEGDRVIIFDQSRKQDLASLGPDPLCTIDRVEIEDFDHDTQLELAITSKCQDGWDGTRLYSGVDLHDFFEKENVRRFTSKGHLRSSFFPVPAVNATRPAGLNRVSFVEVYGNRSLITYDNGGDVRDVLTIEPNHAVVSLEHQPANHQCYLLREGEEGQSMLPSITYLFTIDPQRGAAIELLYHRITEGNCLYFPAKEVLVISEKGSIVIHDRNTHEEYRLPMDLYVDLAFIPTIGEHGSIFGIKQGRRTNGVGKIMGYDASLLDLPRYLNGSKKRDN